MLSGSILMPVFMDMFYKILNHFTGPNSETTDLNRKPSWTAHFQTLNLVM
jgi:hypothetical protein